MTLALTTASASFFATVIGSFFYGLFFILVILSTALHIQRIMRNHPSASRGALMRSVLQNPMIMAGFTLFLTVTAVWVEILSALGAEWHSIPALDPRYN
jgi:hypothetical protein